MIFSTETPKLEDYRVGDIVEFFDGEVEFFDGDICLIVRINKNHRFSLLLLGDNRSFAINFEIINTLPQIISRLGDQH